MKYNFDHIDKESITDAITELAVKMKNAKFKINISIGKLGKITADGRVIISSCSCLFNMKLQNLIEEDLIIILRYLQHMDKCRDIPIKETRYGEVYDLNWKRWEKVPSNKKDVQKKIKEYLSRKKNVAVIDLRSSNISPSVKKIGLYIKNKLYDLRVKYYKNADICYDYHDDSFIIVIDKYEESPFARSIVHLVSDIMMKFKKTCGVLSLKDYTEKTHNKQTRLIYF